MCDGLTSNQISRSSSGRRARPPVGQCGNEWRFYHTAVPESRSLGRDFLQILSQSEQTGRQLGRLGAFLVFAKLDDVAVFSDCFNGQA